MARDDDLKTKLEFASGVSEDVTKLIAELYKWTITVLHEGIRASKASPALGFLAFELYVDLLHGGAYKMRASDLPYYHIFVQKQLAAVNIFDDFFKVFLNTAPALIWLPPSPSQVEPISETDTVTWSVETLDEKTGILMVSHSVSRGMARGRAVDQIQLTGVGLPAKAKPEQQEAIINSASPHIFPKLLSDQAYYLSKEWISLFFTTALVSGLTTNVRTLVEGEGTGTIGAGFFRARTQRKAALAKATEAAEAVG